MKNYYGTKEDTMFEFGKRIRALEDSVTKCNAVMETMCKIMGLMVQLNELAEDSEEYGKTSIAMDMCFEELMERVKANR